MAKVVITQGLLNHIKKSFSTFEANSVIDLIESVGSSPRKGKSLTHVGAIVIKELKYKKFRFYFITDGHVLKFGTEDELSSLLIKFVRMSDKKDQSKVIQKIKDALEALGFDVF
jgi:hypothetical protein